jgi:hypothetical protein
MSLIGTLDEVRIADVLRLFASTKKSGLLSVTDGNQQAVVRFQKGGVVHATAGPLFGEEALLDLFGWKNGQLTFVPEERQVTPNIVHDLDALIQEGLRLGEAAHRRRTLIPNDRVVFQMAAGPQDPAVRYTIGPPEWRVLRLVDGVSEVRELIEASELSRAEVERVLVEMTEAGFLERIETRRSLRVQASAGKGVAEMDDRVDEEWRRVGRFAAGVLRVEVRAANGKTAPLGVTFRQGVFRDIHLPRNVVADLGLREGEEVSVRPIA